MNIWITVSLFTYINIMKQNNPKSKQSNHTNISNFLITIIKLNLTALRIIIDQRKRMSNPSECSDDYVTMGATL